MIIVVHVDVATHRPPRAHDGVRVVVEAETEVEAQLVACQIVQATRPPTEPDPKVDDRSVPWMPHIVMAVGCRVVDIIEL